jgi:hypothetical protein
MQEASDAEWVMLANAAYRGLLLPNFTSTERLL